MVHSAAAPRSGAEVTVTLVLALLSVVIAAGVLVLLPIVSWARTYRLGRELRELRARLAALEERERMAAAREATPRVTAAQHPPVAAAAPGPPLPPLPAPPPPAPAPPGPAAAAATPVRLEDAIGGRLMLWVGTVVLVLGLAFFVKYAFENQWVTETMRVGLGMAAGLTLVAAGHRFSGRGYRAYGQVLSGGGLAVLYLSVYAAFVFYGLIGRTPAFTLLVAITIAAALLADRQNAVGLAVMGVGGGFATPFLVGGGTDAQVALFSYDALLVGGTVYLAARRDWHALNVLSFAATWLTVAAWGATFYAPGKWLRTEVFLSIFCAEFTAILAAHVKRHGWRSGVSWTLALGPALYHVASLAVLDGHGVAPLVYLIAVTFVVVAASARADVAGWRVIAWGAVAPPLLAWLSAHGSRHWLVANLVGSIGIFALHLTAQLDIVFRRERRLTALETILLHLNGYLLVAALYLALENVAVASTPSAALLVGLGYGLLAWTLRAPDRRSSWHALAVGIGALTVACALKLDGRWLTVAIGIEGGLVVALGLRFAQGWFRLAGGVLLASAIARYLVLSLPATPTVFVLFGDEPFAMGAFLAGVLYGVAWAYRRLGPPVLAEGRSGRALAVLAASTLVVIALSAENEVYWTLAGDMSADARFASSLALSFIWALSASAFIAVGLRWDYAPIRYLAMALFGLTVLKVFLADLSALGGLYRILGFLGVGLVLLAVSFVYQRARKGSGAG